MFDQSVGEEDQRGVRWEGVLVVGAGHVGVHAKRQARFGVQVAGGAVGADQERWGVAGGAPVQCPAVVGGLDAGEAGGGDRVVGDRVEGAVELGEDRAGRGSAVVQQRAQHVAGLGHAGGGLEVVADDVADDQGAGAVGEHQGVVPVAADVVRTGGGPVHGGGLERVEVR